MSLLSRATGTQRARKRNDFYPTIDRRAIAPLSAHLPKGTIYAEPCAGRGDLIHLLDEAGMVCDWATEILPDLNRWPIAQGNAMDVTHRDMGAATCFITNPPWTRHHLHGLITHLSQIVPTWLLFDASWAHTQQAAEYGPICTDIVSVGRLKWFAGTKNDPTDDCAWYRFDGRIKNNNEPAGTKFHWRAGKTGDDRQLRLI